MYPEALEAIEIETANNPRHSVIWLHGLGADGHDFEPIVDALELPSDASIRFIFPHAPVRPVTINGGIPMRAWYDFRQMIPGQGEDHQQIQESVEQITGLMHQQSKSGVATDRICLAGFSQGGVIALMTALQCGLPLAAVMGLSTYLPLSSNIPDQVERMPIFLGHGRYDDVLPHGLGEKAREDLIQQGFDVEWHDYPMAHSVCEEEIGHIRSWLLRVLT
jgi:phospholipase/carboxylesterase